MTVNQLILFSFVLFLLITSVTMCKVISGIALTPSGVYVNVYCRYYDELKIYENDFIQIDCSDDDIPEW